ncbi:pyrroline-5-carboxylate reductase [Polycladidibacter stylochi]|uniref:pyrroline-5-carboxylate reductase n=1 Tax=Polycladidibacter stylochi TaxID=1807766 RepID=UPI00082C5390|nr:pyrroline-5-carboxylate reductase [Pseudovibrio stylochi]
MNLTEEKPLVLVGAGKMGGAMLSGWLADGLSNNAVIVQDPNLSPEMAELVERYQLRHACEPLAHVKAGVLLVAVKPQMMATVLNGLKPYVDEETLIVSIAAGTSIATFKDVFGAEQPVVRAMPNTPAQVGRGVTGGFASSQVSAEQKALSETLLQAVGSFHWVDLEEQIDFVTAVSGSGPAYLFYMCECLAKAGEQLGLPPELAAELARGTVSGAGELLHQSELSAETLRKNVTSPGGTTAAALAALMAEDGMQPLMNAAVAAAAQRAKELA